MAIYRTQFQPELPDRADLCAAIVAMHHTQQYVRGNNFLLDGVMFENLCRQVYAAFESESRRLLGRFRVAPNSVPHCWAYVSNRDNYRGGRHHHIKTSTLNGVYYLQVPAVAHDAVHTGGLQFFDSEGVPTMRVQPREHDLLIFPNYLLHEPERIDSDAYRIAINVEIVCDYVWRR